MLDIPGMRAAITQHLTVFKVLV